MTPLDFRTAYGLSESAFKRLKAKVQAANPDAVLTTQDGNQWLLTDEGKKLLTTAATSRDQSPAQSVDQSVDQSRPVNGLVGGLVATGQIARHGPVDFVDAELVDEVVELQIALPDLSAIVDRAHLEIANTAQVASGNRNLLRTLRRKALIEAATADAISDFALADKAYAAVTAQLEQQQLNALGLGQSAQPVARPAATSPTPTP